MTAARSPLLRRMGTVLAGAAALILMLGTSVTAARLVTGQQIKDGTVTGIDIKNGSLTGTDVKDGSLTPADYSGEVVGPAGPTGAPGPAGMTGAPGPSGLPGVRGITYATSVRYDVPAGKWTGSTAKCPAGGWAISGGFAAESGANVGRILSSAPLSDGTGWSSFIRNEGSVDILGGYTWVTCARTR